WELRAGPATFRTLRERCGTLSPTVLNARLKELRDSGIVELVPDAGYQLSPAGQALLEALQPLQTWAQRWLDSPPSARRATASVRRSRA
ncbi:MAG TPA: helix-turn-helix domain-containing protein, partial [Kofleriaceae bacterium]|nr:helix-turn-helix domain-containing protein [Kofleriaceae bacterium]